MMARVEKSLCVFFSDADRDRSSGVRRMDVGASWKGPGQAMEGRAGAFFSFLHVALSRRSIWNSSRKSSIKTA
jgi:hypothetical protein